MISTIRCIKHHKIPCHANETALSNPSSDKAQPSTTQFMIERTGLYVLYQILGNLGSIKIFNPHNECFIRDRKSSEWYRRRKSIRFSSLSFTRLIYSCSRFVSYLNTLSILGVSLLTHNYLPMRSIGLIVCALVYTPSRRWASSWHFLN
jgi:hypothetical protein